MHRLPPLIELRAFEAAARHLSFKAAAAELFVTPTAISHQIRLLEEYCGQPLFRRRPRPLSLTWAGEQLFEVVHDGLGRFADTLGVLREATTAGRLKVTATNAFAALWIVPRLPQWRAAYPRLRLDIIGTDSVLSLKTGEADVAIRYAATPPADGVAIELARDSYHVVGSPALIASRPKGVSALAGAVALATALPIPPRELADYPLIECEWAPTTSGAPTWQRWESTARRKVRGLPPIASKVSLSFREELHGIQAALAGQGIAVCSDVLIGAQLADGSLRRMSDITLPGFTFFAVHRSGHPRQAAIDLFVRWIREQFAEVAR